MKMDNIAEEGRSEVERLRKKYVISSETLKDYKEQELLKKMYECQDLMEELLDKGNEDSHYKLMETLINRLEKHIQNNQDLM